MMGGFDGQGVVPEPTEAELVRQALLEQEQWEAETTSQLAPEAHMDASANHQLDGPDAFEHTGQWEPEAKSHMTPEEYHTEAPGHQWLEDADPYKQQLLAAAAREAVPPVRASELSARLAQGSEVAAKAAAEIAARLASARAHARSAHAADDAAKLRSEKTMGELKDCADSAKSAALEAVAAHEQAEAEVQQASEEVAHARMLAEAANEVLELAQEETEAAKAIVSDSMDPDNGRGELEQLERDVARSTAAMLASKAAHQQLQSAVACGADELQHIIHKQLHTEAERRTLLESDDEDLETRALRTRREDLAATLAELQEQARQCETSQAAAYEAAQESQWTQASAKTHEFELERTRAKAKAIELRAKAADLSSSLVDAKKAAARLTKATHNEVGSPGTVQARGEHCIAEMQASVEEHENKAEHLATAVMVAQSKVDAAQRDLQSAETTAQQLADRAAVNHQQAITVHETARQRSMSVRSQLTRLQQDQAHAQAATLLAKGRLQAAREHGTNYDGFADVVERLHNIDTAAQQDADQATERVRTAQERLAAAKLKESSCRAAAEAAANAAAASRLESATSAEDDITVQTLRNACTTADQFLQIRQSRLESADNEVCRLETSLQETREAFAALTARAHSPRTEQAERTAAQKKKEALRAEKLAELKQLQAKRSADAVLQFLNEAETVTLVIKYNPFYGTYNEQQMLERLMGIGAPESMARGVSSWLQQGAAEIKGPLRKARAIMTQLQAVDSLNVGITPTAEQTLQAERAGVNVRGVPGAEELALERELSVDDDSDSGSSTNALLEVDHVSDTKHRLIEKAQKARIEQVEADRFAAEAAAASSEARWGAAASAYEDQQSPHLQNSTDEATALVDRMNETQTELDGAKRLAKLAQEDLTKYEAKHSTAHDKLDAALRDKDSALEEDMARTRARVMSAEMDFEKAVEEVKEAGHALTGVLEQQTICIEAQRRSEAQAATARAKLESATKSTNNEVAETESAVATCCSRLEALHAQTADISTAAEDAKKAEQRFAEEEEVRLAQRVSAEVVGRALVDEVQRIVDQRRAELEAAQHAAAAADSALTKVTDDCDATVARVQEELSVAMSAASKRKEAEAAQEKVDVLRAFLAMTIALAEQRSAAADAAEEAYNVACELEEKELESAATVSEAAAQAVQKHSDRLLLLRDEIDATEQNLKECKEKQENSRQELDIIAEAVSAAETKQRELEHRASQAAQHAAAAEQTLLNQKVQLQDRQAQQEGAILGHAKEKVKKAKDMVDEEVARVQAEQERYTVAEAAEASALQWATLKKAEASRTAESALEELAKAQQATALTSHDCQVADEAVARLETALQEAQALARAAKANEDEARALAIASPGRSRHGVGTAVDDSWAELTLHGAVPTETYEETISYVHRTDSGNTTLRLSSPPREKPPARRTTISFGPDRFDDEGPPAPKWVPASTGGGNPDYGLVSAHAHATGSARSTSAESVALNASARRPPSPETEYPPATRKEQRAESLSKANPYSEPRTVHQKGHHLNRARSPTKRRTGSNAALRAVREAEREQTFQRLSSPSRARNVSAPSGSFAHPDGCRGDTLGHTFSEAMARQQSSFKRKPAAPLPAAGATMRLHKNEESLYELKDRIEENAQPRYMDAVADSMMHGQKAAQDRQKKKAAAEAQRMADELAAEEDLKAKAQAVAAVTLKARRRLKNNKSRKSSRPIWERTEQQLHRRAELLEQKRQQEKSSKEQIESQAKWGADVGRLWACVHVLYEQLKLATALFEQVKYEVCTGQDSSGSRKVQMQQAFENMCDLNSDELTLSMSQREGLFGVLSRSCGEDGDGDALRPAELEMERDAFGQLCNYHHSLCLSAEQCDQLLELVRAGHQQDTVVKRLTATFEDGKKWSATVNTVRPSTHLVAQQRWEEWENMRNARMQGAKRLQEEATAATLRDAPELKNSFAKRASTPVSGRVAAAEENAAANPGSAGRPHDAVRRKPTTAKKKTVKKKPPWEVQGYRGISVEPSTRSQTPQRRQREGTEKRAVAPSPPRVYGLHTEVSEEKGTKGALEAELLRQSQWRERTVPNLSRSFASVANDSADIDSFGVTVSGDAETGGAGSPTLSIASSATVRDSGGNFIPPDSQLPQSVAQLGVKLRSLSYGTSGQDPVKLFRHFDRTNRGGLDQREFGLAVRKGGALTRSQMSDTELRLLFQAVDKDADGFISMAELRDFVWGGEQTEAEAVELVESRRHKSAAVLPLTVGSFAPPSSLMTGAGATPSSIQSGRSATPKRRVGSPKPLHERRTVSSRERWLTVEEQQERERLRRVAAAPDLSVSKQSFETKFAPAARQRKAEAAHERAGGRIRGMRGGTPTRKRF